MDEEAVSTRDHETKKRAMGGQASRRVEERRDEVPFDVVDPEKRLAPAVGQAVRERGTGEQRSDEPRPAGVGDEPEGRRIGFCL